MSRAQHGGTCATHGVYSGWECTKCAETSAKAQLRQATWEATQFMTYDEVRAYVAAVLREVESDEP